ncbi:MAG: helix-turn-helix transcriptional regulator [Geothrix sp.]|uniref:helix-turn-helix domain-containing protein n=1 Tax=Geothrix sp. TaxID=1962974 RepID=UPI001836F3B0|nr:helix-turn-helix transcriptional regulator [Geothrix sp.]NWJ40469.1 helix-turn-helix transcriptional regulator [Geothrix sp.]WIL21524.1 MAG: helix-turn-helix domain-containing protein [Geothrix sp.]
MPNIASILKSEIMRLARKEIKSEIESLKNASAKQRTEIAALKRHVEQLERQSMRSIKAAARAKGEEFQPSEGKQLRFSPKRFASMRKKLGLSAADLGLLIGVAAQTIYHWEAEKTRPRANQLKAIAEVRGMGKRQIKARLEALQAGIQETTSEA